MPRAHEEGKLAPDERSRLQLAEAAKAGLGDDAGITLMVAVVAVVGVVVAECGCSVRRRVRRQRDVVDMRVGS